MTAPILRHWDRIEISAGRAAYIFRHGWNPDARFDRKPGQLWERLAESALSARQRPTEPQTPTTGTGSMSDSRNVGASPYPNISSVSPEGTT